MDKKCGPTQVSENTTKKQTDLSEESLTNHADVALIVVSAIIAKFFFQCYTCIKEILVIINLGRKKI